EGEPLDVGGVLHPPYYTAKSDMTYPKRSGAARASTKPMTMNGLNGISLRRPRAGPLRRPAFCRPMASRDTMAPIQKAKSRAATPAPMPRAHPMDNASLPSPKPIHLPFEKCQKAKKNRKKVGPATTA